MEPRGDEVTHGDTFTAQRFTSPQITRVVSLSLLQSIIVELKRS